ncbi:hypothetical protein KSX_67370 [Ktedonospora formicarum]|uniref:Uncharacterized protein n=1 Tax=Ktedonospora formicarum TaxID=2778364 RepID=A0A8J3IAP5_9CHLR|nr:hypothetical protein KSX_67370 [Ktedonospora formicarum]
MFWERGWHQHQKVLHLAHCKPSSGGLAVCYERPDRVMRKQEAIDGKCRTK